MEILEQTQQFSQIFNISDIPKEIWNRDDISLVDKGQYKVACYNRNSNDLFLDPFEVGISPEESHTRNLLREMRGLVFDSATGDLIRRPLHKIKNIGESVEVRYENIDLSQDHWLEPKLDGTMIAPFYSNGIVIWGTKRVDPEFDEIIGDSVHIDYYPFVHKCLERGMTPIFEYIGPDNQIVLEYSKFALVLLAIRHIETGTYLTRNEMMRMLRPHPTIEVNTFLDAKLNDDLLKDIYSSKDIEGYILCFNDGRKYKIKSDWYVDLHRARSAIEEDHLIVQLHMKDQLDDLLPKLSDRELLRVGLLLENLRESVVKLTDEIIIFHQATRHLSNKEFADISEKGLFRSAIFHIRSGRTLSDFMDKQILHYSFKKERWKEFTKGYFNWN